MPHVDLTELLNSTECKKLSTKEKIYMLYVYMNLFSIMGVFIVSFGYFKAQMPLVVNTTDNFRWEICCLNIMQYVISIILGGLIALEYALVLLTFRPLNYKTYSHWKFIIFVFFDFALISFAIFIGNYY